MLRQVGVADICWITDVRTRSCDRQVSIPTKPPWQIFSSWLKGGSVQRLPASVPHHLPQEVSGSRWEVMELCGSGGGDMTSCQALMQANIWRLWATLFLACWQGPLAWSQKPPPGAGTGAWETVSSSSNAEWQHSDFHCEERKRSGLTGSPLCVLYTGHRENANASK